MVASSDRLKPGEKGEIAAKVATAAKQGLTTETIEVQTNDPKHPAVILTLEATVLENLLPYAQPGLLR